jgi:hypothetical protein
MKIDISISLKDEQGELKRALGKLNDMVEQEYERLEEKEVELELNQLEIHIPEYMRSSPSPSAQTIREAIENMSLGDDREIHKKMKEGVERALKRVGVVRPKLNAADLLFQGLYGSCDFEGINSEVLDKHFKVVRVPGFVYYKMNKGVMN